MNKKFITLSYEDITVLDDLKNLISPLTIEEQKNLEESILKDGCLSSLILWKHRWQYILVDGHNRCS